MNIRKLAIGSFVLFTVVGLGVTALSAGDTKEVGGHEARSLAFQGRPTLDVVTRHKEEAEITPQEPTTAPAGSPLGQESNEADFAAEPAATGAPPDSNLASREDHSLVEPESGPSAKQASGEVDLTAKPAETNVLETASTMSGAPPVVRPATSVEPSSVVSAPQPPAAPPVSYASNLNAFELRLFTSHNVYRQQAGLAMLQIDGTLTAIARQRAADMAARSYFSHYAPETPNRAAVFILLDAYGYRYAISGENIARNNYSDAQSADVAMNAFLNSPGHRDNIMDGRYRYVGVGSAVGANGMKYYAVVFAG